MWQREKRGRGFAVLLALSLLAGLAAVGTMAAESRLEFSLEDQFGRSHEASELEGRVAVVVATDRRARGEGEAWVRALRERLATQDGEIVIVRVLDLRGVPFFMKAMIRKQLSQRPDEWCLLDWGGQVARDWPLERGVVNLLVFDRGGRLAGRESGGAPEAEPLASLIALVESVEKGS